MLDNKIVNGILNPEDHKVPVVFSFISACEMQIKREFFFTLSEQNFDLELNILKLHDDNKDIFKVSGIENEFNAITDTISRYVIVSSSVSVIPLQNTNGYFWGGSSETKIVNKKNHWSTKYMKINNGIRIVYIPNSFDFYPINEMRTDQYNIFIFTEHNVSGTFKVTITKNINWIPFDYEMFSPYKNLEFNVSDLNRYRNKNIISTVNGNS